MDVVSIIVHAILDCTQGVQSQMSHGRDPQSSSLRSSWRTEFSSSTFYF